MSDYNGVKKIMMHHEKSSNDVKMTKLKLGSLKKANKEIKKKLGFGK